MNLLIKDRINTQWALYKSSVERSQSFWQGLSLFFILLYFKIKVRIESRKFLKYWMGSNFNFNGIKLTGKGIAIPNELKNFGYSYEDVFFPFIEAKDIYNLKSTRNFDLILFEGPYFLEENGVNVTISANDVVLDCGAWIGDFSAYASFKGAKVFAFEPFSEAFSGLEETARLNNSIFPIKFGLSDRTGEASIETKDHSTAVSQVRFDAVDNLKSEKISLTTIDEFVIKENLQKVDFIKADIEGHERFMLMGAKETLRKFAPKLAICTYHLPDDPEVLSKIILEANPAYKIIQKKKKLFASVPEN
jgi:FkbM family methyltransferase